MSQPGRSKLLELEALRGIAAVMVVLHHFLLLIAPRLHGRNFPEDPIALVRTPLFALVNGTAAVAIFFVLSGFVLTRHAMATRDRGEILIGALKRWPRLVPLVVTVNVLSAIFFLLGLYSNDGWFNLGRYAGESSMDLYAFVVWGALAEGVYSTFINGRAEFNAALWTMHYELFGSFAAYATAVVLILQKSPLRALAIGGVVVLFTATLTGEGGPYFAMLVAGVLIARTHLERETLSRVLAFMKPWRTPLVVGTASLAAVAFGYDGYSTPVGFYAFLAPYASPQTEPLIHGIAAVAVVALVLFCEPIRRHLLGTTAKWAGRLSFPIYLVHLPILHGVVSPIHSGLVSRIDVSVAAPTTFIMFIGLTLIAAYPLALLDEWWVQKLRGLVSPIVTRTR